MKLEKFDFDILDFRDPQFKTVFFQKKRFDNDWINDMSHRP